MFDLIENVLAGKDRSHWLDGVQTAEEQQRSDDAIWTIAAERGNGSPNSEPVIRGDEIYSAQDTAASLKQSDDFVRLPNGDAVSRLHSDVFEGFEPIGGWDQLSEADKLSALLASHAADNLYPDKTKAFLMRHVDFN